MSSTPDVTRSSTGAHAIRARWVPTATPAAHSTPPALPSPEPCAVTAAPASSAVAPAAQHREEESARPPFWVRAATGATLGLLAGGPLSGAFEHLFTSFSKSDAGSVCMATSVLGVLVGAMTPVLRATARQAVASLPPLVPRLARLPWGARGASEVTLDLAELSDPAVEASFDWGTRQHLRVLQSLEDPAASRALARLSDLLQAPSARGTRTSADRWEREVAQHVPALERHLTRLARALEALELIRGRTHELRERLAQQVEASSAALPRATARRRSTPPSRPASPWPSTARRTAFPCSTRPSARTPPPGSTGCSSSGSSWSRPSSPPSSEARTT